MVHQRHLCVLSVLESKKEDDKANGQEWCLIDRVLARGLPI